MRKVRLFSAIFGILGVCFATMGVYLALRFMNVGPILLEQPDAAREQVVSMMDALAQGDYETVSASLYGTPDLGLDREAEDEVGQLFWEAYRQSITCELVGSFYATESGVAHNVVIRSMELDSVTENLKERSQELLEERVEAAEDLSEIYDENYEYREDFVMAVLRDAAQEALTEDAEYITWEVTLNLIYENGQWWIMPEDALLEAISGGILS